MTMMIEEFIRNATGGVERVASGKAQVTDTPLMKGIPDWGNTRAAVAPERVKINISVTIKIMRYASDYNYLCHCSYFWQMI